MMLSERYHPERYRRSRPFARQVTTLMAGNRGLPSYELFQSLIDTVYRSYNNEIMELPFESRPDNLQGLMRESSMAMHYARFCSYGRQIFHFNKEITEQFLKTDVDEVVLDSIRLPYDVLYLSFGKQPNLNLWGKGFFVDGAYVTWYAESNLEIMLTTIPENYEGKPDRFDWIFQPERYYYLPLETRDRSRSVAQIADAALKEDLAKEQEALSQPSTIEVADATVVNRRAESAAIHIDELREGYPVFREALRLVINGLCYLSAYPDDIQQRWPDDTPASMLEKLERSEKPKEARRTVSKLTSMGYVKIHYCGRGFERLVPAVSSGREVRVHWRRGHWRNQPYGPQLAHRKLLWIMPVMVRKDKAEDQEIRGHIYLVDAQQSPEEG